MAVGYCLVIVRTRESVIDLFETIGTLPSPQSIVARRGVIIELLDLHYFLSQKPFLGEGAQTSLNE